METKKVNTNLDFSKLPALILENKIKDYKTFYKAHLTSIKDRQVVLSKLHNLCQRFKSASPTVGFMVDNANVRLEMEAEEMLKTHFPKSVFELYNKDIPDPLPTRKMRNPNYSLFIELLDGISQGIQVSNAKSRLLLENKTQFLSRLYDYLYYYGLHPDLVKRDPKIYKRYNFVLEHYYKSPRTIQTEYKKLLTPAILHSECLTPYEKKLPIKINGKLIPFKSLYQVKITSTLLLDDEIELYANKNNFSWKENYEDEMSFINQCHDETEDLLRNPFLLEDSEQKNYFVDPLRIAELRKVKSKIFDLVKLIKLCEELNNSTKMNNIISTSLLVRAIIDHVPPVFDCSNFSQVANNYSGGKSFKKAMQNLENSLRNIADSNIHSQVREKEVLPTPTQVNYKQELDLLLGEIVRILK